MSRASRRNSALEDARRSLKSYYFVRHGQTEWNRIRRMRGRADSGLTDLGRRQADACGELVAAPPSNALVVSHGVIGRVMLGTLIGFADERMRDISQPNDVVYRVCVPSAQEPDNRSRDRYEASVDHE